MEPGPVVTEFERKVYEDAESMDLSGTDKETAKIFREIYLPYSKKIFASLGQTPEEVAEASDDFYFSISVIKNEWFCKSKCIMRKYPPVLKYVSLFSSKPLK